ncbi:hypothetical protein ALC56_08235 [Trachymyrmex septentrionalis]|uniref:Gustatory receptor n=1 Tax=Trachymyrmex septentrionalis TaxID=34720 RepID=A0A151JV14_9HYME|nr:hypothetical protein ALC56_08235 [Trachymyrmex septentrionalis]
MTKTLQTALAPLLIIGSFCSLGLFEYFLRQPYLSCLYTLTIWSYFTYFFYYPFYIVYWLNKVYDLRDIITTIIAIISILLSHYHLNNELKMCLHELSVIDDTLEALDVPKEYQRLRNFIIRIIIGWIVCTFYYIAYLLFLVSCDYEINFNDIFYSLLMQYPKYVNILSILIWGTILRLVY